MHCANKFKASFVLSTNSEVISAEFSAKSAAWESENIFMYFGFSVGASCTKKLLASKIPFISAWKTVDVSVNLLLLRIISLPSLKITYPAPHLLSSLLPSV